MDRGKINVTAKSRASGHEIIWDDITKNWVYADTYEIADEVRPCAYCGKKPVGVKVKIPDDLSHTSKEYWKYTMIDACIAPIVKSLQESGIDMRGSCCGHGKGVGDIHLHNGRAIIILSKERADKYFAYRKK